MIYITGTYMLNIEKRVFIYKYTFSMIVHTYILVYTLNMQKCDIVDTVRATPKPASSMAHSTVTRALALWAHT